jgi:hypothetical protein
MCFQAPPAIFISPVISTPGSLGSISLSAPPFALGDDETEPPEDNGDVFSKIPFNPVDSWSCLLVSSRDFLA